MEDGLLGKEYGAGEVVCCQGDPGDWMFVVQAGEMEVLRTEGGVEVPVGVLSPGDVFGEMAIFEKQPRSATVRTKGEARVLTLDKRAFLRHVHEDPSMAFRILQKMSSRIRGLNEELSRLKRHSAQ
jgi:CRP/FNR family cyclic AMP-dependent transcriptional regulator